MGAQLAGLIGAVGAVLIIGGIQYIQGSEHSKRWKWISSIALLIIGILAVLFVRSLVVRTVIKEWPNAALSGTLSQIPYNDQPFVSSSTSDTTTSSLSGTPYIDQKAGFSTQYPKDWTINHYPDGSNVDFEDPAQDTVGAMTISAGPAGSYTLETYSRGVLYNVEHSPGGSNLRILDSGTTELNGKPAYEYEFTYAYIVNGQAYPFHGIELIALSDGTGYAIFVSSLEQSWATDLPIFNASIATFRY